MNDESYETKWTNIDTATYDWSVKVFRSLKKMLRVSMKLHAEDQVEQGDIFLFNHFSRFETFIPQYLIHELTGAYSCAIASGEFFEDDSVLAKYLAKVGVIPHNHKRLFPILAQQIFQGRKVIIFPEGGMVKDRQVLDKHGHYNIFSRISGERRKHHTGAAVLAQGIEAFKATIRNAYSQKNTAQLLQWRDQLQLDSVDQLLLTAIKPTLIVPSNITFYPIRSSDNMLRRGAELFAGGLTLRQTEELLIEGNIILKDTDMDLRMGKPVDPYHVWHWWNRYLLEIVASEFKSLDEVFSLHSSPKTWKQRLLSLYFKRNAKATRNEYMEEIYENVTINLSHLASTLIMYAIGQGLQQIKKDRFYKALYIAIKLLQNDETINLHRSLLIPEQYGNLIEGKNERFEHFIGVAEASGLIAPYKDTFHFLHKLCEEHDFDTIRMENLIAVYDNEAEPIEAVLKAVIKAYKIADGDIRYKLAEWYFDDECRALKWNKITFDKPQFKDINDKETAVDNPEPFLLRPEQPNGCGILLIHGLLATPAEMIGFGEHVMELGYTALGVRLKGHGTSPYDLREHSWEDWYETVVKNLQILTTYCDQVFVCGFSTGGALALKLTVDYPQYILGVIAVAVPLKFVDPTLMLVPLLHGTNKLVKWMSSYEGVKHFVENEPEHPTINYRNTPIRSLYELRRLIQEMEDKLPEVTVPVQLIFADNDPIVALDSGQKIYDKLKSSDKELKIVKSDRHGILMDNTGETWETITDFLGDFCPDKTPTIRTEERSTGLIERFFTYSTEE
jgi:esterase/lipase